VADREATERALGEQIARRKKENREGTVSALDVAQAVKADLVLTGALCIEGGGEKPYLVRIASFQLVEVSSGNTPIRVLMEPEKGMSFSQMAAQLAGHVKK
jgi:hypothetical protein